MLRCNKGGAEKPGELCGVQRGEHRYSLCNRPPDTIKGEELFREERLRLARLHDFPRPREYQVLFPPRTGDEIGQELYRLPGREPVLDERGRYLLLVAARQ